MTSVYLFHRDFRVVDNLSLDKCEGKILPIFIFDPRQISKSNSYRSTNSIQFMIESLLELKKVCPLKFYYGKPEEVVRDLLKQNSHLKSVYHMRDYTTFAQERNSDLNKVCEITETDDVLLNNQMLELKSGTGSSYQKFTSFYNKAKNLDIPKPHKLSKKIWSNEKIKSKYEVEIKTNSKFYQIDKIKIPINQKVLRSGGRTKGLDQLKHLPKKYASTRDNPSVPTSELSAYIKFGCISIREVYYRAKECLKEDNLRVFHSQLWWNNFCIYIQYHFNTIAKPLKNLDIKWIENKEYFEKWKNGQTGIPFVDASMRQLNSTGFCHNRGRLVVSNVLSKWLLIDWRKGEKYFAKTLYDYDPCSNNLGWAFTASVGVDYQIRIYNPYTQGRQHDKDAVFIKDWIPELKEVPAKDIHTWDVKYKNYPNINYPKPMIDSKEGFQRAKKAYFKK